MLKEFPYRVIGIVTVGALTLVGIVSAQAVPGASPDGMEQLLLEVRGLRVELTQAAGASMRMQLLLARLALQEQRITVLSRQQSEVQEQLTTATHVRSATADQVSQLITAVQSMGVPPEERRDIENHLASLKRQLSEQQQRELQLQSQVAEISAIISAEQGRWLDFNARLDDLERSLPTGTPR